MNANYPVSNNVFSSFYKQRETLTKRASVLPRPKENDGKLKKAVAVASLVGATVPLALYNIKKGKLKETADIFANEASTIKDKVLGSFNILEVENIKQIAVSLLGSITAGTVIGNALDNNKENKKARYKEGLYGTFNTLIPMGIITGAHAIMEAKNIKPNLLGKAGLILGGITSGMILSNKVSNKINKTIFHDDKKEFKERKMKLTDCLVHLDDILGVLVISKIPFAEQIGKILPLIYAHVGYEAGVGEED